MANPVPPYPPFPPSDPRTHEEIYGPGPFGQANQQPPATEQNWFQRNMGNDFWNFHNDVRRGYLGGINHMPFVMKPRDVMHPTELNPKSTPQLRRGMYPNSEAAPLGLDTRGLDILQFILSATRENPGALFQLLMAGNPNVGSPPLPGTTPPPGTKTTGGGGGPSG